MYHFSLCIHIQICCKLLNYFYPLIFKKGSLNDLKTNKISLLKFLMLKIFNYAAIKLMIKNFFLILNKEYVKKIYILNTYNTKKLIFTYLHNLFFQIL